MAVREKLVTYKGKPITLVGEGEVHIGDKVPNIRLAKSMEDDLTLADLQGKIVVLNVIPSIDTPVCSRQTKRFNDDAVSLGDGVVIVGVSMDLPFAIGRWCAAEGVKNVLATSDYKYRDLGREFSIMMRGLGLLARSVFVIDREGILRYEHIVPRMEDEPDYQQVLDAVARYS